MNKLKLNLLTDSLPITAYGFENTSMATQIMSVDEYIKHHKDPYYCESIILPDGRIVLARPSHMAVLDSLLNHINGSTFVLSPYWFVEERLYYTDSILVWKESQQSFTQNITNAQKHTLEVLEQNDCIVFDLQSFPKEKQEFFTENVQKFHQLATKNEYNTPLKRFGLVQPVKINDQLVVFNSFSQLYYGRDKDRVYTNEKALIANLNKLDTWAKEHNLPAYVPARIGCGLAGGNWNRIKRHIENHTDIIIVDPNN